MKKGIIIIALMVMAVQSLKANNLNITNVSVPSATTIQFDISWDNSWNVNLVSNDAVWIFIKAQVCGSNPSQYLHANLSSASPSHSVTGGVLQVDAVTDGKGVFIRRSGFGTGNIAVSTVILTFANAYVVANTNYEVLGIEMVYVAQGSFAVGDGSTDNTTESVFSFGSNNATPRLITSEGGMGQDYLRNNKGGDGSRTAHAAIIAGFPKGFNSFYCMKYEISQQQYVAFLNLLDFTSQGTRTSVFPGAAIGTLALTTVGNQNRNSIEIATSGIPSNAAVYGNDLNNNNVYNENGDGGDIACNFLSWDDLQAYLDWSALRPMTELEYEKACRGSNASLLVEYPWGTTVINQAISSALLNSGLVNEVSTSIADGLCAYNGGPSTSLGPIRVGFAATAISTKTGAGASTYGILDLGGNLSEQVFQCGYYNGSTRTSVPIFTGVLGDGLIDGLGNADVANWGGGVALSTVRGGNWEHTSQRAQVSDRFYVNSTSENATRINRTGGRGVRQF